MENAEKTKLDYIFSERFVSRSIIFTLLSIGAWYLGISVLCAIAGVISGIALISDAESPTLGVIVLIGSVTVFLSGLLVNYFCRWLVVIQADVQESRQYLKTLVESSQTSRQEGRAESHKQ